MKTPLATVTLLGDTTVGQPLSQYASDIPEGIFAKMFNAQIGHGINGDLPTLTPAKGTFVTSISASEMPAFIKLDTQALVTDVSPENTPPANLHALSATPELPIEIDPEAIQISSISADSHAMDSETADISQVPKGIRPLMDEVQAMDTGTPGNLQAEVATTDVDAGQSNQTKKVQKVVLQHHRDASSAKTSLERTLDQQILGDQQDQHILDKDASVRTQEYAENTHNSLDALDKEAITSAQHLAHTTQQFGIDLDVAAHNQAMNNAVAIAEAMRPTQLPANEFPARSAFATQSQQAFKALSANAEQDKQTANVLIAANNKPSTVAGLIASNKHTANDTNQAFVAISQTPSLTEETAGESIKLTAFGSTVEKSREAMTTKSGMTAVSLKDPSLASTAAILAIQQSKADTNTGTSQDTNYLTHSESHSVIDTSVKNNFSTMFGTLLSSSGSLIINGVPQVMNGLYTQGTASHVARLDTQVGQSGWNQALGQHMVMMAGNSQQTATLTLNPPDLGPLQVVLQVHNSQAEATFITAQPEVKQALEDAFPKLREMMGQAGIELGQATVNTGSPQQQTAQQHFSHGQSTSVNTFVIDTKETAPMLAAFPTNGNGRSIVDIFA